MHTLRKIPVLLMGFAAGVVFIYACGAGSTSDAAVPDATVCNCPTPVESRLLYVTTSGSVPRSDVQALLGVRCDDVSLGGAAGAKIISGGCETVSGASDFQLATSQRSGVDGWNCGWHNLNPMAGSATSTFRMTAVCLAPSP